MNKFKTNKIVNALTNLLITLVIVVVAVSFSNNFKSTENLYNDTNTNNEIHSQYEKCSLSADKLSSYILENVSTYNILQQTETISMFPELSNLKCLGKVSEIKQLNDNDLLLVVATSPRFSSFVGNLIYILFFTSSVLLLSRGIFFKNLFLIPAFILSLDNLLFINRNTLIISSQILITLLGILFYKNNSDNEIMSSLKIERIKYRNDINVLRAISVVSVVLYHADIEIFKGGWLGVDIFFVISGYLITNIIFSEFQNKNFSLKSFYIRRLRRIFPALYFMLLATIPFSYILLNPKSLIEYLNNLKFSLPFLSNVYLSQLDFYTAEPNKFSPLLHTWSLSIEEQFYLFFPIIFLIFYRLKFFSQRILVFLFSFLIAINLLDISVISKFYLFHFRSWEFVLGFLIMIYSQGKKYKPYKNNEMIGLFLIFGSVMFFDDLYIDSLFPKFVCLIGVSILLLNLDRNLFLEKLSNIKLISTIGLISYSIYLYHQPIYAFIRIYLRRNFQEIDAILHFFIVIFITIISFISYKFIEKPFNNNFNIIKLIALIFIIFICLAYTSIGLNNNGFSSRYEDIPDEVVYYSINTNKYPGDGSLDDWDGYSCDAYALSGYEAIKDNPNLFPGPCVYIKNNSVSNFILIGDSHANTLSVATIYWGEKISNNFNFIPLNGTVGRCLLSAQNDTPDFRFDCTNSFFNNFLNKLNPNDKVAIIGRFPIWVSEEGKASLQCEAECNHIKIMEERIKKIASKVEELIIIYPVPTHPYSITASYFYRQHYWGEVVATDYEIWRELAKDSYLFLDSINSKNIIRIKTEDFFCNTVLNSKCLAATENELYYSDTNHLTIKGNQIILPEIIKIINK